MADGHGFGVEGDWKTSALLRVLKAMGEGKPGGTSFMEEYTYHLGPGPQRVPWRAHAGGLSAVVIGLLDLADRFRLVSNAVDVVTPDTPLPKLPVAHGVWSPRPSLPTSAEAWLLAGGPHHTVLTASVSAAAIADFAAMSGTELLVIDEDTALQEFDREVRWKAAYDRLAGGL